MKNAGKTKPPVGNKVQAGSLTGAFSAKWKLYGSLGLILLISLIIYLPVFQNGLLAWDDDAYIKNNPLLSSFNLKEIFSQYVKSNYHPFTILILAIEYQLFGLNPAGYHTINLLLHLVNVILVFYAVYLLSEKSVVALVASLLFGIHPMHVESVAWVAELKDLLYTAFFLASYVFYMKYAGSLQKKHYAIALSLFLVSLLSKAMAASLPVVLILTDYFKGRKINRKTLLEKAPFFLLAAIFGIIAVIAQKSSGAAEITGFSFPQRIVFACLGFLSYLIKLVAPVNLSAYYPYPVMSGENIPGQLYIYIFLFLALAVSVYFSLRLTRKIFFGMAFFTITVFLVLQLLPVGGAVMADRYSYIPSIGIFYLAGEGFYYLWMKRQKWIPVILLIGFAVFFSIETYARCGVWKDDITLWNDVLSKNDRITEALINRGIAYKNAGKTDLALADLNKAIDIDGKSALAYFNRGIIFEDAKKYDQALANYNRSVDLDPGFAQVYNNRGNLFSGAGRYDQAIADFNKAVKLEPHFSQAYNNRGSLYANSGKYDLALADFNKAVEFNPGNPKAYSNRGNVLASMKKYDEAIADFSKAINLNPSYPQAYFNRATILAVVKKHDLAIADFSKAISLLPDFAAALYGRGMSEYNSGKKDAACRDFASASRLGYRQAMDALQQLCQ